MSDPENFLTRWSRRKQAAERKAEEPRVGAAYDRHKDFTSLGATDTGYAVKGGWNFGVVDFGFAIERMTYKCKFSSLGYATATGANTGNCADQPRAGIASKRIVTLCGTGDAVTTARGCMPGSRGPTQRSSPPASA